MSRRSLVCVATPALIVVQEAAREGLPRNAGEDLPDPRVVDLGERHDALRITRPKLLRTEDLTHA